MNGEGGSRGAFSRQVSEILGRGACPCQSDGIAREAGEAVMWPWVVYVAALLFAGFAGLALRRPIQHSLAVDGRMDIGRWILFAGWSPPPLPPAKAIFLTVLALVLGVGGVIVALKITDWYAARNDPTRTVAERKVEILGPAENKRHVTILFAKKIFAQSEVPLRVTVVGDIYTGKTPRIWSLQTGDGLTSWSNSACTGEVNTAKKIYTCPAPSNGKTELAWNVRGDKTGDYIVSIGPKTPLPYKSQLLVDGKPVDAPDAPTRAPTFNQAAETVTLQLEILHASGLNQFQHTWLIYGASAVGALLTLWGTGVLRRSGTKSGEKA